MILMLLLLLLLNNDVVVVEKEEDALVTAARNRNGVVLVVVKPLASEVNNDVVNGRKRKPLEEPSIRGGCCVQFPPRVGRRALAR